MRRISGVLRLSILAVAGLVAIGAPLPAQAASSGPNVIAPVGSVQGVLLTPGTHSKPNPRHESAPFRAKDPVALRVAKAKANAAATAPAGAPSAPAAPHSAAVFNGLNSPGLSAADQGDQPTPPDSTGAVGPNHYVEFVNNLIAVYSKTNLTQLSSTDMGTFTAVPPGLNTSDPQIQWDPLGNRWFYAAVAFNGNFTSDYLLFGWSKTADPSDLANGWCRYASPTGAIITDYPKLGHDANFVIIGDNQYDGSQSGLPFVTADIWAISKPAASATTCSGSVTATHFADAQHVLKNSDGTGAFTPVPANTADSFANGYIVAAHDVSVNPQSKLMVWQMTPGPKLVAKGDISVGASYSVPASVPEPGAPYLIDSLDGRLTQAVAHNDPSAGAEAVWTQHTVAGTGGRTIVRWYELLPGTLKIRQQGQLSSSTDYYWNAAISPSIAGNDAMIQYDRGNATLLALIGAQTRTSSTPLGQMDAGEVQLGSSSAPNEETAFQTNCSPNPCRWGDYAGATPDPSTPGVVWGSNQIDGPVIFGFAQWQTQNFAIVTNGPPPSPPAAPTGLTATGISASQINLSWSASTGATSYKVQRSPDGSTGWTQVGTSSGTTFSDTGLNAATTYFYRVIASNSVGDSGPSNTASASTATLIGYTQAPQGSWVGVYGANGYALLGWNGSSDLVFLPGVTLTLDNGQLFEWSGSTTSVQALQSPDATTRHAASWYDTSQVRLHLTFTSAFSGSVHLYALDWDTTGRRETITINDGSGPQSANITTDFSGGAWVTAPVNVGAGGTVTVSVTQTAGLNAVISGIFLGGGPPAPAAPTGVTATSVSASQIGVSWTASANATLYKIQRSPDGSTGWTQVGTSAATSFTDSGLSASTTYFYGVIASNNAGDSTPSATASATTASLLPYTQAPQGNWVGSYGANGYALLGWNGSSDLVSLPGASLTIDNGTDFLWGTTGSVDALESPDTSTRRACAIYDPSQVRLHLSFPAAYSGNLHIYVLDWDSTARRETVTINDGSGPRTANITTDFSQGAWISLAINVAAGGTVSIAVTQTAGANAVISGIFLGDGPPAPAAPTGVSASPVSASQISVAWTASSGATSYKVQRSPDGSTAWTQVGTSTTTSFADSGLSPATTYFYRVIASNNNGDSPPSSSASATTASLLSYSQAPQGNWVGTYGASGYALLGWNGNSDLVSLPNATLRIDNGADFLWGTTTAVQALESPDTTTRRACTVYDANQVRVHLTFSTAFSGAIHLYALDWDGLGRRETITINDGSGPQTANITTDFTQGAWVSANINVAAGGTVNITVTNTAGTANAVLSGIFLG